MIGILINVLILLVILGVVYWIITLVVPDAVPEGCARGAAPDRPPHRALMVWHLLRRRALPARAPMITWGPYREYLDQSFAHACDDVLGSLPDVWIVTAGFRSLAQQAALYAQGRDAAGSDRQRQQRGDVGHAWHERPQLRARDRRRALGSGR